MHARLFGTLEYKELFTEGKVQMLSRLLGKVERAENDSKSVLKNELKIVPIFVFRIFLGMSPELFPKIVVIKITFKNDFEIMSKIVAKKVPEILPEIVQFISCT